MYDYQKEKAKLFTDEGSRSFTRNRDTVLEAVGKTGAIRCAEAVQYFIRDGSDSWFKLACLDRMVELGDICEVPRGEVAGQDRVFVKAVR